MQNYLSLDEVALEDVERLGPDAAFAYLAFSRLVWKRGPAPDDTAWIRERIHPAHVKAFDRGWPLIRPLLASCSGRISIERLEAGRRELIQKSRKPLTDSSVWIDGSAANTVGNTVGETVGNRREEMRGDEPIGDEMNGAAEKPPARQPAKRSGDHAELISFWQSSWLQTRGSAYAFEAKDGVAAAAVLKLAKGDLAEAKKRADKLLHSSDEWLTQNASMGLLRSRWNQLAFDVVGHKNEPKGAQGIRDYMARHHNGGVA